MISRICSQDNKQIKLAAALRQKKHREETGMFLLEGIHLVESALAVQWKFEQVFVCEEQLPQSRFVALIEKLDSAGKQIFTVSAALFKKITETSSPQGVVAIAVICQNDLPELQPCSISPDNLPWIILDAVQDPGNVGTIVRNADAAGVAGLIMTPGCADLYAGKTVRASMGSLFHIPIYNATASQCLTFFSQQGIQVYIADAAATKNHTELDFTSQRAIVFGNEGAGVSEIFRQQMSRAVAIPIVGRAESLNVASAAAVILYEAARQRGFSLSSV